jgi:D-alanine-D-alanine ligase
VAVVLVLFGGKSAEHEVSCVSAATVSASLVDAGHEVVLVGIAQSGTWHLATAGAALAATGPAVRFLVPDGDLVDDGGSRIDFDVVFPVLHGPWGEDGTIQGMLEMAGVPYVGAGVMASAAAMDKDVANRLFRQAGLPIAEVATLHRLDHKPDAHRRLLERFGLPLFVKPAALGSSVGITRVDEEWQLEEAIEMAFKYGEKALVEEAVSGREIEVAVLDGPRTSVPGEIVVKDSWYDYEAKYHDESVRLVVPAPLAEGEAAEARHLAGRAFETLGVRGLARVDFFYEEGRRGFLINELNTMPGCTSRSMFPLLWEASGVSNRDLFDGLVRSALG